MNYEQILQAAKDEVAKDNGYSDWQDVLYSEWTEKQTELMHQAALLAMQRVAEVEYLRGHHEAANQSKAPF
jgi:hypothetical protein